MGLFKRKKSSASTVATRRVARMEGSGRPDFVYYANRQIKRDTAGKGGAASRSRSLLNAPVGSAAKPNNRRRRVITWSLIIPGIVLLGQLILLGNDSEVLLLQADGTRLTEGVEAYQSTLDEILSASILNRTKLTVNTSGVATELQRRHPEIESVVVTVPFFGGRPTAYIAQSEAVFTIQQNASFYTLSASGYITGAITGDLTLPLVKDETGEEVEIGKRLLPKSHVEFMRTVLYQFEQTDIKLTAFVLPANKAYEVNAQLEGKPYVVRFNFEEDALQQSGAAIAVIEQLGSTVPTAYIDVRVPGRAYYK